MTELKKLWYRQPAAEWNDALPLGNGRLGAMVFGGTVDETVQLNEESLWSAEYIDRNNRDALKYRDEVRRLLAEGKIAEAERLTRYSMTGTPRNECVYQTLGSLKIETPHRKVKHYRRELDLDRAAVTVRYEWNGISFCRELFVSAPKNVLVVRFTAARPGSVSFSSILLREGSLDYLTPSRTADPNAAVMTGGTGIRFCAAQKVSVSGGSVRKIGDYLVVENADEALLYVSAVTSFRSQRFREEAEELLERAFSVDYGELLAEHAADYRSYFGRMDLKLAYDARRDELPTDERLKRYAEDPSDNGLVTLYFDFGRYLLISCSRPGTLPANLQGIWNGELTPPWGSKYTVNINMEMNYWPAESCNLSDCHAPLFEHLRRMQAHGRETARVMYGARGFVAHHNTDVWGDTAPQDQWMPATYWVMSAAWLCTHIWNHYEYTEDGEFLRRNYDLIRDACLFFVDYLVEDSKGRLIVSPTVSPENRYIHPATGEVAYISAGCAMDSQILRDLFTICIRSAGILDTDRELCGTLSLMLEKLPKTEIHSNGTIREWLEEYEEVEIGHRHVSHLYGLYPSSQISPFTTPELAQVARKTLERRLSHGGGHTGWSRAWIVNLWARLLDGEKALLNVDQLLIRSTLPNLLDNHPPFQIDGNFGGTAGIAEMLLQCVGGRIVLLPALPKRWADGSVRGIRAKGGLSLEMTWKDGRLTGLTLDSPGEKQILLRYGEKDRPVRLVRGRNRIL